MSSNYYIELKDNMINQIELFNKVVDKNIEFRQAIIEKDWFMVNKSIDNLNQLSFDIKKYELDRVDILVNIIKKINSKDSENLLSIINKSPIKIKELLIDTYYKLKISIVQVQGVFNGLNQFIDHKKDVSKEIIDILVKDSKGNVYTKPGRRSVEGQGFLVNRQQ